MKNPDKIFHISQSQFSIARYYGAAIYNSESYIYDYEADTLIREKSLNRKEINKLQKKNADYLKMAWDEVMKAKGQRTSRVKNKGQIDASSKTKSSNS